MHKFTYIILFLATFISRIVFKLLSGYDNFELFGDSVRYDILSDRILDLNYDLDFIAFIISPLYPYTLAFIKWFAGANWEIVAVTFQFLLVSLSTVYLVKLSFLLFSDKFLSLVTGVIYIFYPMTLFYNFTLSQETTFQSYFIIFMYYFVAYLKLGDKSSLILSGVFYAFAFLTKSHILLFAPFIAVMMVYQNDSVYGLRKRVKDLILFGTICFIFTLPDGIHNYKIHGLYTFSGVGVKTFFYNGNSQENYDFVFHNKGINDDQEMSFIFDTTYVYEGLGKVNALPYKIKQDVHFAMAKNWIISNPWKFLRLKWFSMVRFFTPGVSYSKYNTALWVMSFLSSAVIFLAAYLALIKIFIHKEVHSHLYIFFLITTMLIFYLIFMPQTRFRVISLEPFYIIYAAYFLTTQYRLLSYNHHFAKSFFK
jgi:hypothetical protein